MLWATHEGSLMDLAMWVGYLPGLLVRVDLFTLLTQLEFPAKITGQF
jgi:hypothetical protein